MQDDDDADEDAAVEEAKAAADELNENPEQEGSLDNAIAAAKDNNGNEEEDDDFEMRRQETVGFSTEADEVSFNEYLEKVREKEKTQYLRTSIDSEVRHCQKISQLQTKQTDGYDFYFNYELNTKTWH